MSSRQSVAAGSDIVLVPLEPDDRERFISDNQEAFLHGATQEFGLRDDHFEEDGQIISRSTIERVIDGEHAETWRIVVDGRAVGGIVLTIDQAARRGELELLFVSPDAHSRGIGQAAWCEVERMHPEVHTWGLVTPYFEKRNIHFYVNKLGFHIVEFYNAHHPGPNEADDGWEGDDGMDGMFRFEKTMTHAAPGLRGHCPAADPGADSGVARPRPGEVRVRPHS